MGYAKNNETMDEPIRKRVVVSAVNIRKGGTLNVLLDCLHFLSKEDNLEVTAIVHNKTCFNTHRISYIEIPWSTKNWFYRLWCEYITMNRISRRLGTIDLWLSLHDTTPRVKARHQAVYCQTSFPFMKTKLQDFRMDIKIPLFALFTKYAYKVLVHHNRYLIVQQQWFRHRISQITRFPEERIIVAPPHFESLVIPQNNDHQEVPIFFFPSSPDCHKNFESLCEAAAFLENSIGPGRFKVILTITGNENKYSKWLHSRFSQVSSIIFTGYLSKEELVQYYSKAACLVFPSRAETWGLPISEFKQTGKPMILAELPYSHESASGARSVAFFNPLDSSSLASLMLEIIEGKLHSFVRVPTVQYSHPYSPTWDALFNVLLEDESLTTR